MNEQKESLYIKIIKHVYGIHGYFDEYKKQEVNRIGNNAFLILFCLFWIEILATSFASLLFDSDLILETLVWSNILIFLIIICHISNEISRLNLDNIEAYDDKDIKLLIKNFKRKSIFLIFTCFIFGKIISLIIALIISDKNIIHIIISPIINIIIGISSIFFGLTVYFINKSKIQK